MTVPLIVAALAAAGAVACAAQAVRAVRGTARPPRGGGRGWWLWGGDPLRERAGLRAVLAVAVFFGLLCLLVLGFVTWHLAERPARGAVVPALWAGVVLWLCAGIAAFWTVPLFNRPRFLVAPPHRGEDGLLAAQRRAGGAPVTPPPGEW